jgi:hypothetical protein
MFFRRVSGWALWEILLALLIGMPALMFATQCLSAVIKSESRWSPLECGDSLRSFRRQFSILTSVDDVMPITFIVNRSVETGEWTFEACVASEVSNQKLNYWISVALSDEGESLARLMSQNVGQSTQIEWLQCEVGNGYVP